MLSPFLDGEFKVLGLKLYWESTLSPVSSELFQEESTPTSVFSEWFYKTFRNSLPMITRLTKQTNSEKANAWFPIG